MEVVWSRPAQETLTAILKYIEDNFDSTIAFKVYNKIDNQVDSLAFFPRIGVLDSHFSTSDLEVRYIINTPNIIHYIIAGNTIIIVSVLDTRRNPATIETIIAEYLKVL